MLCVYARARVCVCVRPPEQLQCIAQLIIMNFRIRNSGALFSHFIFLCGMWTTEL